MTVIQYLLIAISAYLIGSFSSGIFISSFKGKDIRKEGSKSSGATNVTRVLGLSFGLFTFLGDFIKASLAIWIGSLIAGTFGAMAAAIFAVIGHNWPVYYHFKGGKGIVCSIATLLLICPLEAGIASALTVLIIWKTKYVSLGSLAFLVFSTLLLTITRGLFPYGWWAFILLVLGLFQHRSNIKRLLNGTESKFKLKR